MAKLSPFDFVESIVTRDKPDLMALDPENEKAYLPFIINRQFSYFADTVLTANSMNELGKIDKRLQYDFYRSMVRPGKRFAKWLKPEANDDVNMLVEYYSINRQKAEAALKILTPAALKEIRAKLSRGGIAKR